ncbi:alpha/beta fold hydrolase [Williamsia sp. SKLECPSW1]
MTTLDVTTPDGTVPVMVDDRGSGRTLLLLHGGAGPASVAVFAEMLVSRGERVVTPTHPGFGGTPRPEAVAGAAALAEVYDGLLDALDLTDVVVVGNSLGGWVAAELVLRENPRIAALVLVDAVGLAHPTEPIVDFFALTMDEVVELSYHESNRDRARADLAALPDEARAAMPGNRAALFAYGGSSMADETLSARLTAIAVPTLIVWGAADHIAPVSHAHLYTEAIPGAELDLIDEAGHLPQIETPDRLADDILRFAG